MYRLGLDITFRRVAHPKHNVLYGAVFIERNTHYVLKPLVEVIRARNIFLLWQGFNFVNSVKGKVKNLSIVICCTE